MGRFLLVIAALIPLSVVAATGHGGHGRMGFGLESIIWIAGVLLILALIWALFYKYVDERALQQTASHCPWRRTGRRPLHVQPSPITTMTTKTEFRVTP